MSIKLGINGFGRIGRLVFRSILEREDHDFDIVGVNDLTDANTLATLFKYDSVHGQFPGTVELDGDTLVVNGDRFPVLQEKDPSNLPWDELGADVVIEATGFFRTREGAAKHLEAGADKVVISAPAKSDVDATIVLGVNDGDLTGDEEIISNASCTTNCLAPMVKVLDDSFGLKSGLMTTVHAYTSSQNIVDGPHKDLRRARTAAESIIPTTTGAAKAVGLVLPHLDGKLDGMAMRVPVPDGSIVDLTANLDQDVTIDDVNAAYKEAADGAMNGVLQYSEEPLVSRDIIHNPHSCIYDAPSTMAAGSMVKIVGWYDNEWGYSNRTVDVVERLMKAAATA
ncbi:type I glyceraldehyde-3-phosphate dehydrogenase [Longibacter salinarum]|uniref:Glyceraldehyde-3-phosphate dehydrogenase n=1 Tax=Longibacter salinarum TaxID=1850348 RepID=A0A2A8CZE7_9BACT|nr:type I glyceraldehyde-3-phosphate dehydrogenase [Longibacter salinarum]PEN14016.1 type I glyceraldehyde-3-phosphate dehydrogenase [Longibacter salinarum]